MIELVIENLDGKQVAAVSKITRGRYAIKTDETKFKQTIEHVLDEASIKGIPLRFDKRQKTGQGIKFQRFARWVMPDDPDFLEALAEDLAKYQLFAYTVEIPSAS